MEDIGNYGYTLFRTIPWIMEFACFMGVMSCGYIDKRGTSRPLTYLIFGKNIGKGHSCIGKNINRTILK